MYFFFQNSREKNIIWILMETCLSALLAYIILRTFYTNVYSILPQWIQLNWRYNTMSSSTNALSSILIFFLSLIYMYLTLGILTDPSSHHWETILPWLHRPFYFWAVGLFGGKCTMQSSDFWQIAGRW